MKSTEMRLRLDLSANMKGGPLSLFAGEVGLITAAVIAEDIGVGSVDIESLSEHIAIVSDHTVPLEPGTYARKLEWSIGAVSATPTGTPALIEVRARTSTLIQVGHLYVTVSQACG